MTTKNETRDEVIIWLLSEFLFHLFSFGCYGTKFLLSNFFFNWNLDFCYQWWQIIKRNAVLFTKKSRYGRVMMNEWLIMSGLMWLCSTILPTVLCCLHLLNFIIEMILDFNKEVIFIANCRNNSPYWGTDKCT